MIKRHQFEWLLHIHLMTSSRQIFVAWSTLYTVHLQVQTPRSSKLSLNHRSIQKGAGCGDAYQDTTTKYCCEYHNSSQNFDVINILQPVKIVKVDTFTLYTTNVLSLFQANLYKFYSRLNTAHGSNLPEVRLNFNFSSQLVFHITFSQLGFKQNLETALKFTVSNRLCASIQKFAVNNHYFFQWLNNQDKTSATCMK